jgi:hypothetical protein
MQLLDCDAQAFRHDVQSPRCDRTVDREVS